MSKFNFNQMYVQVVSESKEKQQDNEAYFGLFQGLKFRIRYTTTIY